ncbi:MAG: preprotein translocase subunit SecY [Candidatus Glassbacteria bacterium]
MPTSTFQNLFKIPELKRKILFTVFILVIYRIGGHIPVPGINVQALGDFFARSRGTLFGMYDMFVGGALQRATIFALGIMPFISASIIFQLLGSVFPYIEKLQREGEEGRKKINQYTRYLTVLLSVVQSYGISIWLSTSVPEAVMNPGLSFTFITILTLTTGAVVVMWLGEQITDRGIGNGASLIIFFGIVESLPQAILNSVDLWRNDVLSTFTILFILVIMVLIIAGVVVMTMGMRKIPIQIPRKIVGRKVYGGQQVHIPLRVNSAGVMPIIFAQSIIIFPGTISQFFPGVPWLENFSNMFNYGSWLYILIYTIMIIFFTYFYTAITTNPIDLAENMKRQGGFIPGIRPGSRTADYIDKVLTRITLPGAFFLAAIAILPIFLIRELNIPFYFGGTGLLIVVGVALDTIQQIEAHLLLRHYDGFMKKGKIRGRR